MTPRLLAQLRIFMDLAADDRAQTGNDVAADPPAAHNDPEALSLDLDDPVMGYVLGRDDQHCSLHDDRPGVRLTGICSNPMNAGRQCSVLRAPAAPEPNPPLRAGHGHG